MHLFKNSCPAHADLVCAGRVWTGRGAKDVGLVDEIGTMDSVLEKKFGSDLRIKSFGNSTKRNFFPWMSVQESQEDQVASMINSMWSALQTRTLWARYGL